MELDNKLFSIGEMLLITTNAWFYAPDGRTYSAAYGKVKGIHIAKESLGVRQPNNHADWFLEIGDLCVAGCQVLYAVKCATPPSFDPVQEYSTSSGIHLEYTRPTSIYNASQNE